MVSPHIGESYALPFLILLIAALMGSFFMAGCVAPEVEPPPEPAEPPVVTQPSACMPRGEIVQMLGERYSEQSVSAGVDNGGRLLEIFATEDGSTWTAVISISGGLSCLVAAGENWQERSAFRPRGTSITNIHMAPSGWIYPLECCSNQDCQQSHEVEITPGGYRVTGPVKNFLIQFGDERIRPSPDDHFHPCISPGGYSLFCLFVPTMG